MTTPLSDILEQREAELTRVRDEALQLVKNKPTGVNRKAYRKACADLEEYLQAKNEPDAGEQSFEGIPEVLTWLQQEWKISKSTLYEHQEQGKLRPDDRGRYSLSRVQEYAADHLKRLDGSTGDKADSLQKQKTTAEVRRILSDAQLRELKLRTALGEYIPKEQVEIELAERASSLKNYFDAVARSASGRVIKLVGGDPQKAPELISWWLGMNRKAIDNYARPIQGLEDEEA